MDVALMSMALSQSQVKEQVSISMLKKSMDQAQNGANGLIKMLSSADVAAIQHAAQPHLGGNIDLRG